MSLRDRAWNSIYYFAGQSLRQEESYSSTFFDAEIFTLHKDNSESKDASFVSDKNFSFNDIFKQGKSFSKDKVFIVNTKANPDSLRKITASDLFTNKELLFVQIISTDYTLYEEPATMIQLVNISANILYDMQKADNKFLQLINACISHELRNPL